MTARSTTALLIAAISPTFAAGNPAPSSRDDVVKQATKASEASVQAIRSGTEVVTFEGYTKEPEEKEARLWAKGQVKVSFDADRYHLRFRYETMLLRTGYLDRQGKEREVKIQEWKPEDLAIIFDGAKAQIVTFSRRIHPAGCQVEIYESLARAPSIFKRDLTRQWLGKVGLQRAIKTGNRNAIQVTDLRGGDYRLTYEPKGIRGAKVETDVTASSGYRPTRYRLQLPGWDTYYEEGSARWKRVGDVWYVAELDVTTRIRHSDKPTYQVTRTKYQCESFEPNAKVEASLFTLDSLTIPPETQTMDRRSREKK